MKKLSAASIAALGCLALSASNGAAFARGLETASISPRMTGATSPADVADEATGEGDEGSDAAELSGPYAELITRYAKKYAVKPALADAVVRVESRYDPKARGQAGEIGLMQIKPATARQMGFTGSAQSLYKPSVNLKYGMIYLAKAQDLGGGSVCGTLLKYNAGHGAERMNPVSKHYCQMVMAALD